MKARQLLSGASYGPDELRVLCKAFDDAWDGIAADVGDNPLAIEAARLKLANLILGLAGYAKNDAERLKNAALPIMGSMIVKR